VFPVSQLVRKLKAFLLKKSLIMMTCGNEMVMILGEFMVNIGSSPLSPTIPTNMENGEREGRGKVK
jgi:hypothetical protein